MKPNLFKIKLSNKNMREAKCPHFGTCGGCSSQHITYEMQLANKRKNVSHALSIPEEEIKVHSANEFTYRNRMDFVFFKGGLGFRKKGSHAAITTITSCDIANTRLQELFEEVRAFYVATNPDVFDMKSREGTFRYATIRTPTLDSSITFILNEDSPHLEEAYNLIETFAQKSTAHSVLVGYVSSSIDESTSSNCKVVKGSKYLTESISGKKIQFHTQGFFQNNSVMANELAGYVYSLLKKTDTHQKVLLDVYGGVGTFGLICAELYKHVYIVESAPLSVECAQLNIASLGMKNVSADMRDASSIQNYPVQGGHSILDPPRTGMQTKAIDRVLAHEPERIIYISCNYVQLKKELPRFLKRGYSVNSCAIFDLFPQTNYVETVIELVRG